MAFCKKCGNEYDENAFVCTKCGSLTDEGQKRVTLVSPKTGGVFNTVSLLLGIVVITAWLTLIFLGVARLMEGWTFILTFILTFLGAGCGLVFGILTKNKINYCINTAALTLTILVLLVAII